MDHRHAAVEERGGQAHRVGGRAAAAADHHVAPGETECGESPAQFIHRAEILVRFPVPGFQYLERDPGIGNPFGGPGRHDDGPPGAQLGDDLGQEVPHAGTDMHGVRLVAEIDRYPPVPGGVGGEIGIIPGGVRNAVRP